MVRFGSYCLTCAVSLYFYVFIGGIHCWATMRPSISLASVFAMRVVSPSTLALLSVAVLVPTLAAAEPMPTVAAEPGFLPLTDSRSN